MLWLVLYIAAIVGANAAVMAFGLIPIGPLLVPAGTFLAGLTFGLRDLLQRDKGKVWTVGAILIGAGLSALLSPQLAVASGAAFLLSELLDLAVYSRLLRRGWTVAVVGSNVIGGLADTALFLLLAGFWSWPALVGVILIKWSMTLPILALGAWHGAGLSQRLRRI